VAATRVVPDVGPEPAYDGETCTFVSGEAAASRWFDRHRSVVFINGMGNSGADHRRSALTLSLLQMCPVVGVYNLSGGFVADLVQSLGDKLQFDGPFARPAAHAIGRGGAARGSGQLAASAEAVLRGRNPAAGAMFTLLRRPEHRDAAVFAHSQGNLILSNVLSAIEIVDGAAAVSAHEVYTFGSPAKTWPHSTRLIECGFTFDPVTWLAGMDGSFSIAKLGMPADSSLPITHSFVEYMRNDAAFVVNRFRWGGLGTTFSMDEAGLAKALVRMGHNMPRVQHVFEHLSADHNSDVDDVALLYVEELQHVPEGPGILQSIAADRELLSLLIRSMEEGWTSGRERHAIEFLQHLRG
jgi:hypothetical protein